MVVVELPAQGLQLGDVDLLDIAEVRDPPLGLGHLLGDPPPQADDLDLLVLARRPPRALRRDAPTGQHRVEVLVGDPSARA